jgi:hypothetical protein
LRVAESSPRGNSRHVAFRPAEILRRHHLPLIRETSPLEHGAQRLHERRQTEPQTRGQPWNRIGNSYPVPGSRSAGPASSVLTRVGAASALGPGQCVTRGPGGRAWPEAPRNGGRGARREPSVLLSQGGQELLFVKGSILATRDSSWKPCGQRGRYHPTTLPESCPAPLWPTRATEVGGRELPPTGFEGRM